MDELDHPGWVAQQSYVIGGYLVGIRTNSEPFSAWLDDVLSDYRASEETDPHFSVLLAPPGFRRGSKPFHILYRESTALVRSFDLTAVGRTLFAELEACTLDERDDAIYVDAGVVRSNGVTALVPSILPPYLLTLGRRQRAGVVLPEGTRAAIDPESGETIPIELSLGGAQEALEELASVASQGDREERVVVDRPEPIDVVCSVGGLERELVQPVSKAMAVLHLAKHVVNMPKVGDRGITGLVRLVERARCYEIRSASTRETLRALTAAMQA